MKFDPVSMGLLRDWFADSRGQFAIVLGIVSPLVLGLIGGAVDAYVYVSHQKTLQSAADGAALASAREAAFGGWSAEKAQAVAAAFVAANATHGLGGGGVVAALATVDAPQRRVSVTVEQDHYGYFVMGYFRSSPQIRVSAVAQASGSVNVCVIGLNETDQATVILDSNAVLFAPDCAVYSNSVHTKGMQSLSNAVLTSSLACSAGGFSGAAKNFSKNPLTDCPMVQDPLVHRAAPQISTSCKENKATYDNYNGSLMPGVYCGGLAIKGNSNVTLLPGIFIIKDGQFLVDSNSVVKGTDVGMYFTGAGGNFHFNSNVNVSLAAPKSGPLAEVIFFQDRDASLADFVIESNYTRNLLGTIYLPKGNLIIKADNDVADQSAYTAIVVHKLQLFSGPRLVLNTDYDSTTVPVPEGLGPSGSKLRLVQ